MLLERILSELTDGSKPVRHTSLTLLSGLSPEELDQVKADWTKIQPLRRRQVISRLVELAEDNVEMDFNALFEFCFDDPDEEVRQQAIAGLWESEERHLISPLIRLLECDPSPGVRAAAAQGLGKFVDLCQEEKLPEKDGKRIYEALLAVITHKAEPISIQRRALEAISAFPNPELKDLIKSAYEYTDPGIRESAVYAMGRNSNPNWLPIILKELSSEETAMRYEAASACGRLGDAATLPHLLPLLRDDDVQVRVATIHALGAIGGAIAKKALLGYLKSPDDPIREAAQEALESLEFDEEPISFQPRA